MNISNLEETPGKEKAAFDTALNCDGKHLAGGPGRRGRCTCAAYCVCVCVGEQSSAFHPISFLLRLERNHLGWGVGGLSLNGSVLSNLFQGTWEPRTTSLTLYLPLSLYLLRCLQKPRYVQNIPFSLPSWVRAVRPQRALARQPAISEKLYSS